MSASARSTHVQELVQVIAPLMHVQERLIAAAKKVQTSAIVGTFMKQWCPPEHVVREDPGSGSRECGTMHVGNRKFELPSEKLVRSNVSTVPTWLQTIFSAVSTKT
jgi:hypothetical protein